MDEIQHELELILTRQLASCLSMAVCITDPLGKLLYYNDRAESILGRPFEEIGTIPAEEWSTMFSARSTNGDPVPLDELPLMVANTSLRPAWRTLTITAQDGVTRTIQVTACPLIGVRNRHLGAVAMFSED